MRSIALNVTSLTERHFVFNDNGYLYHLLLFIGHYKCVAQLPYRCIFKSKYGHLISGGEIGGGAGGGGLKPPPPPPPHFENRGG